MSTTNTTSVAAKKITAERRGIHTQYVDFNNLTVVLLTFHVSLIITRSIIFTNVFSFLFLKGRGIIYVYGCIEHFLSVRRH
jgi:hypothetical protein